MPRAFTSVSFPRARRRAYVCAGLVLVLLALLPGTAAAAMSVESGPKVAVAKRAVTIWWKSSSTGSSELRWGPNADRWEDLPHDISNTSTTLGTVHSRTITGLAAGTYYFRVRTTGALGTATSAAHKFVVGDQFAVEPLTHVQFGGPSVDVEALATSTDNKLMYVGGTFTTVGRYTGGGAPVDATTGVADPGAATFNRRVVGWMPDGSGGAYAVGRFSRVGALTRTGLVHILPDGGVDPYFNVQLEGGNSRGTALARNGSTLYVSGDFTQVGGQTRNWFAAIDTTTNTVTGWNPNADNYALEMRVSGGTVYAGGYFSTIGGATRNRIAALDGTTGNATAWNPNITGTAVRALELGAANRIYAGGLFTQVGASARTNLAEIDLTTGAATAWVSNTDNEVETIAYDGATLYIGGKFTTAGSGTARNYAAAVLTSNGSATAWNPNPDDFIYEFVVDGANVLCVGFYDNIGGQQRDKVAIIQKSDGLATAFTSSANDVAYTIVRIGSRFLIGGAFGTVGGTARRNFAAIDVESGEINATINPSPNGRVRKIITASATRLYVAGDYTTLNGSATRQYLAAIRADDGLNIASFDPDPDNNVHDLVLDGTTLYAGGQFNNIGGQARASIAALATGTALATTWNPSANNSVFAMHLVGTTLYVGGVFTQFGGVTNRANVAALDTASNTPLAWNPGANGEVSDIAVDGTTAYVSGYFTTLGGAARNGLGAVPTGSNVATAWNPNPNVASMSRVEVLDGYVYVGGYDFTTIAGESRTGMARFDAATGAIDTSFDLQLSPANRDWDSNLLKLGTSVYFGGTILGMSGMDVRGLGGFSVSSRSTGGSDAGLTIVDGPRHFAGISQKTVYWETSASSSSELVWDKVSRSSWSEYEYDASNTATNLGTKHSRTIGNLPAGTYYYRVRSRTAGGQQVTSAEKFFVVEAADAQSPINSLQINGNVTDTATSSDGNTIFLSGSFNTVAERSGSTAFVNATTGAAAASMAGMPQVAGVTLDIVDDGSGGWFIAGRFEEVGGMPRDNLAHLFPDGGIDPYWDPVPNGQVNDIVRVGSTIYFGGSFTTVKGVARDRLAAIDIGTQTPTSWNPGADNTVWNIETNGTTLYAGGLFTTLGGQARNRIGAVPLASSTATAWNPNSNGTIDAMYLDGTTLWVGGGFSNIGGQARTRIAALNTLVDANNATAWNATSFTGSWVYTILVSGGNVYVGGNFTNIGGQARRYVAQLSTATGAATAWNPDPSSVVRSLMLDGSTMYLGGDFFTVSGSSRRGAAAVDATSGALQTFNPNAVGEEGVGSMLKVGSELLIGGRFASIGGTARTHVIAVDSVTGNLRAFNAGVNGTVRTLETSGGVLYLGGIFSTAGGQTRSRLAGIDETTGVATAFDPNVTGGGVSDIEISGTTLYAVGDFTTVNGATARAGGAAFTIGTSTATAWDPNFAGGSPVELVIASPNVFVAGTFGTVGGQARPRVASVLATTGAVNLGFNANITGTSVEGLEYDGTRLYIGGDFTNAGGQARASLASLSPTDGTANGWAPTTDGVVYELLLDGSDLHVGGDFELVNGSKSWSHGIVDKTTGASGSWSALVDGRVTAFAKNGERMVVAGWYSSVRDMSFSQSGFAMYDLCDRTGYCDSEALRDYVSMSLSSSTVSLGSVAPNAASGTGSVTATVYSNATNGYSLLAYDSSDTDAISCTVGGCAGQGVPDWTGTDAAPTTWAPADTGAGYGVGVTVLTNSGGAKLSKWGTGTLATDFATNKYAGMIRTQYTTLHSIDRFLSSTADTTTINWRIRVPPTQPVGNYSGTVTMQAVPNP